MLHEGVAGLYCGPVGEAWSEAAELSSRRHVVWLERPVKRALSIMPAMYDDLWVAGKGMYKMEPAIADGGEVVIYAPHVREVSHTHGRLIEEIGYHCKDYFLKQWERFKDVPGGILAHSTHVKGQGSFDPTSGEVAAHPRDARDRASRPPSARRSTSATSTRRASTSRSGGARRRRSWCRAPGRCSTACRPATGRDA